MPAMGRPCSLRSTAVSTATPLTFDQISPALVDATTAVEDKTFWSNTGFDPLAIVSAAVDSIRGDSRGASTITQQLVRQRLLDPALVQDPNRRVERKIKEIIQSIRLTDAFPGEAGKQKIITAYLNQNFYGNNSYGVEAAAQGYFHEDADQLTLAQAAILAGIPQSPVAYDLVRNAVEDANGNQIVPSDSDVVLRRNFILESDGDRPDSLPHDLWQVHPGRLRSSQARARCPHTSDAAGPAMDCAALRLVRAQRTCRQDLR